MLTERNCLPSAKATVYPIAAIDRRFHSPFKRRLLSDPDYPPLQSNILQVARFDRIFRSGTVVRCWATANSYSCAELACRRRHHAADSSTPHTSTGSGSGSTGSAKHHGNRSGSAQTKSVGRARDNMMKKALKLKPTLTFSSVSES
jgi:hypothetical protein